MNSTTAKFVELPTGALFVAHDCLWRKTGPEAAVSAQYGHCNFTLDPQDAVVEAVSFDEVSRLVVSLLKEKAERKEVPQQSVSPSL